MIFKEDVKEKCLMLSSNLGNKSLMTLVKGERYEE